MRTILAIKHSRFPNRNYLSFSDGFFLPMFVDDIFLLKLKKGQEISDEKFEEIIKAFVFYSLYEFALRQIAFSPKSENIIRRKLSFDLRKKLIKYKIPIKNNYKEIINNVILKLNNQNLLNKDEFLKYFIRKNKKKSNQELMFLLKREGFSENQVSPFLEKGSEIEKIKIFLHKKKFQKKDLSDIKLKNKIYGSLYRKGFSLSQVRAVIDCYHDSE